MDQADASLLQLLQRFLDVLHLEAKMMDPLAMICKEPGDRRLISQGGHEFQSGIARACILHRRTPLSGRSSTSPATIPKAFTHRAMLP